MRFLVAFTTLLALSACRSSTQKISIAESSKPLFTNMRQITFEGRRAGEGYPSADGRQLIFQSERDPENPFYQIFLMDLQTGKTHRVSPGKGKTTCSWIHPSGKRVLFSSTHADPDLKKKIAAEWEERKNPKSKYNWSFDETYDIYEARPDGTGLRNLTHTKGYDAEASYSPDGKWIAFASNRAGYTGQLDPETAQKFARDPSYLMDIYIMRADGTEVKQLTHSKGYDGGPFFSPDGKRLTFRRFSEDGHTAEIYTMNIDGSDQKQITRLKVMSWAPFYHPSGDYLIFATNKQGYANFELYIVDVNGIKEPVRVTELPGFDGLPAFTPDGKTLIWTHSLENGEAQLFRADWDDASARHALGLASAAPGQSDSSRAWVEYLASEKFEGRATGGMSEPEYTAKLAQTFESMGLKPGFGNSFLQKYEFTKGLELGSQNSLSLHVGSRKLQTELSRDWIPLSYSNNGDTQPASVVFAGYGIVAPESSGQSRYDSYADLDVKGKWAMVFSGLPEDVNNERRFYLHIYSRLQHKALAARQNGAAGLIVIEDFDSPPVEMKLSFEGRNDNSGLPVIRISAALADEIFQSVGTSRKEWTQKLKKGEVGGVPLPQATIQAKIDLIVKKGISHNVVAVMEAKNAKSAILVGAHLDHLGRGEGGNSLSKEKNVIHFGADDNASGVAGVVEIAQILSEKRRSGNFEPRQNIYFALWTGEEIGVLGSSYFLKNPPPYKITSALNLDMIGRLREALIIQGVGSAKEWKSLIEQVNFKDPLTLRLQEDPYLPTDALSFYLKEIPSISFFTGSHPQYHTGEDKAHLINYEGLNKVANWAANLAERLASSTKSLVTYQKVEGSSRQEQGRGFRLYLGTIPDYSQEGKAGVLISGTSKDSPAEKAGLKAGDVIIQLGGMKIQNLNDYVYCLQALKANEKVKIRLLRAGLEKEMEITPALKNRQ